MHERVKDPCRVFERPPRARRPRRPAEARQIGNNDVEGEIVVLGVRLGERSPDLAELPKGAGPAVDHEQRDGWFGIGITLLRRFGVQKVDGHVFDLGRVVREGVDLLLHGVPVKVILPGFV
jgi:hypothetical protein